MRIILFVSGAMGEEIPSWQPGRPIRGPSPRMRGTTPAVPWLRLQRQTRFRFGFLEFEDDADEASR